MISATELKWIEESVESGKVDAIVAHKIITALKNQQDQIKQLEPQIKSIQGNVPLIEKNAILNMIAKLGEGIQHCGIDRIKIFSMKEYANRLVK